MLDELEKLRGAIRQARTLRQEKVAEFELFVRNARMAARVEAARADGIDLGDVAPATPPQPGPATRLSRIETERPAHPPPGNVHTGTPPQEPSIASSVSAPPALDTGPPPIQPAIAPVPETMPPAAVSRLDDMSDAVAAFPEPHPWRSLPLKPVQVVAAGAVLVLLAAVILWSVLRWRSGTATPSSSAAQSAIAGTQSPASPSPGATAGTGAPAAPARPLQVELTAVRPVWMRVTVDGERVVEGEVPKDKKLQFGADRAIVIRAGDAGAVMLSVDGEPPAPLGRAGQIGVRTVTPKAQSDK